MDALEVLARLARHALDDERRVLSAIDETIAKTREQLSALHEAAERERRAACTLVDGNARLVAYLRRVNARAQGLQVELDRLENEREVRAGRLADRHLELKRLEVLAERRSERRRAARMRTEQQALDELVLIRRHLRARG